MVEDGLLATTALEVCNRMPGAQPTADYGCKPFVAWQVSTLESSRQSPPPRRDRKIGVDVNR